MKTLNTIMTIASFALIFTACGGSDKIEAKKAELEKLKSKQAELASQIKNLEDEIAAAGVDLTQDVKFKQVAITVVKPQTYEHGIDVQGKIDGDENVTYSAKAPSVVTRVLVKAGDHVSEGTVLAELDAKIVKAQIESLKKSWELANTVYEKQKSLWEQKIGSELQYLQAKNNKEALEKQMTTVKENLDMYMIRADFSGTVDEVNIKVGQTVAPGLPCIRIVNLDKLKVKADLSESYASKVKKGNEVRIYFPDIDKTATASISYCSKAINPMTRTFGVEIDLPSAEDYRPNMVSVLKIVDYRNPKAIMIPINTIQSTDGKSFVYVAVADGKRMVARKREVSIASMYNGNAEITTGIGEGDQLITTGFQDLNDGEIVKF